MKCNTWGLLMRTDCMKSVLLFCLWPIKETHFFNRKFSSCIMVRLDQTQNAFVLQPKSGHENFFSSCTCFSTSRHSCHSEFLARELSPPSLAYMCVPFHKAKEKDCLQTAWKTQILNVGFVKKQSLQITIYAPPHVYIHLAFCHPLYLLIISSIVVLFCININM